MKIFEAKYGPVVVDYRGIGDNADSEITHSTNHGYKTDGQSQEDIEIENLLARGYTLETALQVIQSRKSPSRFNNITPPPSHPISNSRYERTPPLPPHNQPLINNNYHNNSGYISNPSFYNDDESYRSIPLGSNSFDTNNTGLLQSTVKKSAGINHFIN